MEYSIYSLLEKIKVNQIDDLILEEKLVKSGFKFHYLVDNHDILRFCFPGGFSGELFSRINNEINFEIEADIIATYEDFFYNKLSVDNPIIFLDEYIYELKSIHDQIIKCIQLSELFNYADTFYKYLDDTISTPNIRSGNIYDDFTLFIAIATGYLSNGAQKYNYLLRNPNFIIKHDSDIPFANKGIIEEIFFESFSKTHDYNNKILKFFPKNRLSKRIDSEAISRIVYINKKLLLNNDINHTNLLFLYLSSTETSKNVFENITNLLPEVFVNNQFSRFNFHRTVEQLFLKRLFQDLTPEIKLERYESIKMLIIYKEYQSGNIRDIDFSKPYGEQEFKNNLEQLEGIINSSLKELREKYIAVNFSRNEQFRDIEKLFSMLNQNDLATRFHKLNSFYKNLKEISLKYDTTLNVEVIKDLEAQFKIEHTFIIVFKKSLQKLSQSNTIEVSRGKDPISGAGQHMPVVFIGNNDYYSLLFDEIAMLYLNQFAFYESFEDRYLVMSKLQRLATNIYGKTPKIKNIEDKLVFCLYLLVLPEVQLFQDKLNNDYVKEFLISIEKSDNSLFNHDINLYSDFLYILTWVFRRNTNYDEALISTNKGLTLNPKDPRFHHSKFLINACKINENEAPVSHFYDLLEEIKLTKKLYEDFFVKLNKPDVIRINIEATLLNSEIYTEANIVAKTMDNSDNILVVKSLNKKIRALKNLITKVSIYDKYPEFLHTEALVSFLTSEFTKDMKKRKDLLFVSINLLNAAINKTQFLKNFKFQKYVDDLKLIENRRYELEKMS